MLAFALSVACVPAAMLWLDHALRMHGGGGFAIAPGFSSVPVPWLLQVCGLGLAFLLAFAALLVLLEAAGRWLDPRDLSAPSLGWALRGVVPVLLFLLVCALAALAASLFARGFDLGEGDWQWAEPFLRLLAFAMFFFVWNPAYVASAKPRVSLLRPSWPGWLAVALPTFTVLLAATPGTAVEELSLPGLLIALILLFAFLADIAWRWIWLNRSSSLLSAARVALRPSVFLPSLLLDLRWLFACCATLLVLWPIAWLLIFLVPLTEGDLQFVPESSLMLLVQWSRFAIAWWWAICLAFSSLSVGAWTAWYRPVSAARLLHQLGLVREDAS